MRLRNYFVAAAVAPILLAACGSDTKTSSATTVAPGTTAAGATTTAGGATTTVAMSGPIVAPAAIKSAGKLVWCSDISYPPEEFYDGTTAKGSDIEVGTEIAKRMGVSADFVNTGFDGIIPALLGKKCDAIISGMNDTTDRAKQVDFVDYMSVGQSFMVQKGNPANIKSLDDIAGKTVSVEVGTSNADFLKQKSAEFTKAGKKKITIQIFPKDTDAANALRTGKVDAYFGDAPVVAYYVKTTPDAFAFGGDAINPIPVGIAIRKGDELKPVVQTIVDGMYSDGSMLKILGNWEMTSSALKK
jgi:polar amino acid transport system substrate-binding protein